MGIRRAEPFYFGPAARPIFGWYHAPEGRCRDGVVLATALGLEGTRSHWSYRHLAERLASAGFGVLRFDWGGLATPAETTTNPIASRPGWVT